MTKNKDKDFDKKLSEARALVKAHKKAHGDKKSVPEAETSRRVDDILCLLCGYDSYENLNRELRSRKGISDAVDFAVRLHLNDTVVRMIVEVKSITKGIGSRDYNQVGNYARKNDCDWTVLTDSENWQLLHTARVRDGETFPIEEWNLLTSASDKLQECFALISLKNLQKEGLDKEWQKRKPLTDEPLTRALFSDRIMNALRNQLKVGKRGRPKDGDLFVALRGLLREDVREWADEQYKQRSPTPGQQAELTKKRRREAEAKAEAVPPPPVVTPDDSDGE